MSDTAIGILLVALQIVVTVCIMSFWLWRVWDNPSYRRVGILGAIMLAVAYVLFVLAWLATRNG